MTLKIRSRSHNFIVILPCLVIKIMQIWLNPLTHSEDNVNFSNFWHKFSKLFSVLTLKMRSRSPNPRRLFIIPRCCILANFDKIRSPNQEILNIYQWAQPTLVLTPTPAPSGPATKGIHPKYPLLSGKINRTITYFPFLIQNFKQKYVKLVITSKTSTFYAHFIP